MIGIFCWYIIQNLGEKTQSFNVRPLYMHFVCMLKSAKFPKLFPQKARKWAIHQHWHPQHNIWEIQLTEGFKKTGFRYNIIYIYFKIHNLNWKFQLTAYFRYWYIWKTCLSDIFIQLLSPISKNFFIIILYPSTLFSILLLT